VTQPLPLKLAQALCAYRRLLRGRQRPRRTMSTEPLGLTPGQTDQLRNELGVARRRRWPVMVMALVIAVVLAGAGGYLAGHSHPRTAVRTVTRVEHDVTVRTVTRWRTRTRTKTADSGVSSAPCVEQDGTVVPAAGAAAAGAPGMTTCTLQIEADVPAADGDELIITAPDGTSGSYQLGSPAG